MSPICAAILSHALDEWWPPRGPCAFCGHCDARHRVWDAIIGRSEAGESVSYTAWDYDKPEAAIRAVLWLRPYQEGGAS